MIAMNFHVNKDLWMSVIVMILVSTHCPESGSMVVADICYLISRHVPTSKNCCRLVLRAIQ